MRSRRLELLRGGAQTCTVSPLHSVFRVDERAEQYILRLSHATKAIGIEVGIARRFLKQWLRGVNSSKSLKNQACNDSRRRRRCKRLAGSEESCSAHGGAAVHHLSLQFILRASRVRAPSECRDCDRPPFVFSIGTLKLRNATKENRRSSELLLKKPSAFGVQCRQVGRFAVSAHFVRLKRHYTNGRCRERRT